MSLPSFARTRRAILRGETSCVAEASSFLAAIEAKNPHLNAFTWVNTEGALSRARQLDAALAAGQDLPLAGLVLAVKDVLCIKDWKVTCASRMLSQFTSLYDATAIDRLRAAGAVFIGKTNCDEFAMGSSNENSCFGPVHNPRRPGYAPGGSSGGSAAAVAAGLCHAALGSDTGGSVRQPAAFCGVVGLKPTYGRVSRHGLVAFASSFDCVGPLANSVEDVALILEIMAGIDARDATSAPVPVPRYVDALTGSVRGLRIGIPTDYYAEGLDPAIHRMIDALLERLRSAGARVSSVAMPHTEYGIATYYILATAEASSNLARYDGVRYGYRMPPGAAQEDVRRMYSMARTGGFGQEVKRRIMLGTYVLSSGYYDAYYGKAQRVRSLIRQDFDRAFEQVDLLLTPVTPFPGFKLGSMSEDPLQMYLSDIYTVTANLAGAPGLVVPIGAHPGGLPVGLQLLARPFDEARLLCAGDAVMNL